MTNQLELTPEVCDNLLMIMQSSDKDNLTVASEMLRYIDVEANLPYLLILYKEAGHEIRNTVFIESVGDKIRQFCKVINMDTPVTYTVLYNEIKMHKVSPEAMNYFLDKFSKTIRHTMMEWGFSFLSDFNLKLIPIKNDS